mmetsp:Transcript_7748/g.11482  ORF Transcript_7748/g.11482 Transcript_7748/m.11482 type:complete len:224 (-) Transcript_7748:486-1157(-)
MGRWSIDNVIQGILNGNIMLNFFQGDSYGNLTGDNNVVRRIINKDDLDLDKVTIIDLSSCELITDEALKLIGEKCSQLHTLDVEGCSNVTDEGIRSILQSNPDMDILSFYGCKKVKSEIIRSIVEFTPNIKYIIANDIGWTAIPDDIEYGKLAKLHQFGLNKNDITKLPKSMINLPPECCIEVKDNPLEPSPKEDSQIMTSVVTTSTSTRPHVNADQPGYRII